MHGMVVVKGETDESVEDYDVTKKVTVDIAILSYSYIADTIIPLLC